MTNYGLEFEYEQLSNDFSRINEINTNNLLKIINDNKDTKYGKKYDFVSIKTKEEYSKKVPLTNYSNYRNKIIKTGDYTVYPVYDMLLTSGSVGKQKEFPITTEAFNRYSSIICDYPHYLTKTNSKYIHTSVFRELKDKNNILSASYYRWLNDNNKVDFDEVVGGRKLLFTNDINDVPYVKTWLMFSYPDLAAIQSIYFYEMLILFKWIEDNWRIVIKDMKNRRVSIDLKENIKNELLSNIPNDEYISKIEYELNKGFDDPFIPRLFHKLRFVGGIGGNLFSIQEKQLDRYIGSIPKYEFAYATSECIIGVALELNKAQYALLPNNAYYEFLTKENEILTDLKDLKIGETYEIVITTFSGLYRYRLGDLLKIVRFEKSSPVFEIVGKREQIINIGGEKIDSTIAIEAISLLSKKFNLEVHDFAFGINTEVSPFGYHIFIENMTIKEDNDINNYLDYSLSLLSEDYDDLRKLGLLSKPIVHFVDYGLIQKSMDEENKIRHNKPQIFLNEFRTNYLLKNIH